MHIVTVYLFNSVSEERLTAGCATSQGQCFSLHHSVQTGFEAHSASHAMDIMGKVVGA